jgi:hypothetical protein
MEKLMATLKNTTINDTGFLTLPNDSNTTAGTAGQVRYNPAQNRMEFYHTRDNAQWEPMMNPFLTRQIVTTGYLHGGYAASAAWNNTNRIVYATDTTINLGDNTQEWAHNYQSCVFNRTRNFTLGAGNGHCIASTNVACFDMRTETAQTSAYGRTFPVSNVNSGTVQKEEFFGWWQNATYSANIYELNLTVEQTYVSLGSIATMGGQLWGTNHENYGIFWSAGGSGSTNFVFATRTNSSRGGTSPSGDGYQHTIMFKQGVHLAGREGNPSSNWRKTNFFTNSSFDALGAKPAYSGEENNLTAQDWGYAIGWYQGTHVNTAFKFIYATDAQHGTTSSMEAKGKAGNSSGTMSWRD